MTTHLVAGIEAELTRLAQLQPGWDGRRAVAPDTAILEAVRRFLRALPEPLAERPAVVPLVNGAVQLEWHAGPKTLELEFESPLLIHFLQWDPPAGVEEEDTFPASDLRRATALICQVHTP